jgi:hypothetical protein
MGTLAGHGSSTAMSAVAPPASAMFFMKLTVSFMRWSACSAFQKSCLLGEMPARKPKDDCGSKLWFNFEQNAQASANQYGTGRLDGKIRFRNSFCSSVVGQPARLLEVINSVHHKEPAKSRRPRRNSTRMISCKETFRFWPVRRRCPAACPAKLFL